MKPDKITVVRDLLDHLNAALTIADDLSQNVIGAMLCECRERASQLLITADRGQD